MISILVGCTTLDVPINNTIEGNNNCINNYYIITPDIDKAYDFKMDSDLY